MFLYGIMCVLWLALEFKSRYEFYIEIKYKTRNGSELPQSGFRGLYGIQLTRRAGCDHIFKWNSVCFYDLPKN